MTVAAEKIVAGAVMCYWHDSGCMGFVPVGVQVLKRTPKTCVLRDEWGNEARKTIDRAALILDDDLGRDFRAELDAKFARLAGKVQP